MGFAHWNVPYIFFAPQRGAANRRRGCSMVPLCGTRMHGFTVGMHPPFSFRSCPKRKRAVHGPKEKAAWTRSGAVALRAEGGRRIGACSDLALPSGTLGPSAIPSTAVPWRMVRKLPGCKDTFELLRFSCLALRRSGDFRHQCSTGSSFRAFGFATRCPGGHGSCSLALC